MSSRRQVVNRFSIILSIALYISNNKYFLDLVKNNNHENTIKFVENLKKKSQEIKVLKLITLYSTDKIENNKYKLSSCLLDKVVLDSNSYFLVRLGNTKNIHNFDEVTFIESIADVAHVIRKLSLSKDLTKSYFFRGHGDMNYKLVPSIFRDQNINNEKLLYDEFLDRKNEYFINKSSVIENLALMQHYGIPTRLLDISSNPFVGLFFACFDNPKNTGELLMFEEKKELIKYIDSTKVIVASMISQLKLKGNLFDITSKNPKDYDVKVINKLNYLVKKEIPHFDGDELLDMLNNVYIVKSRFNGESRMINQSGYFIMGTNHNSFEENAMSKLINKSHRLIIRSKSKRQILNELNIINLNQYSVLTSLEDTAKYLRNNI